jgi:hypothetical protein
MGPWIEKSKLAMANGIKYI